ARDVKLAPRGDGYDPQRREYNDLVTKRLETGRNNTVTDKYVTLTVEAESVEDAKIQLARMVAEDSALIREIGGCKATQLDGTQRVRLLQHFLRPGIQPDFTFDELVGQALSTKDAVSPMSIDVSRSDRVSLSGAGEKHWQTLVLRKLPPYMSDRVLKELADIPLDLAVSIHIDPLDQSEGLSLVKGQIASMDIQRGNELRKLAKQGLGEDMLPHELQASRDEAIQLRNELEESNERLFSTTIVIGVAASTVNELGKNVERVQRVCGKHSCNVEILRFMQLDGLNTLLPLGHTNIPITRALTTAAVAIMVPFTTQEIMHNNGMFYGINTLSKNLIVGSRIEGMNSNAFFLGTSGSGKSQLAKFEMMQVFLRRPSDEILIIDPEREYIPLANELKASRVVISPGSTDTINALHLDRNVDNSDGDPLRAKCSYVLALCEVLLGGSSGLSAEKRSIIDRCAQTMYSTYLHTPELASPTLDTLYEMLRAQPEPQAHELATALELYARGSASGFAQQTNVDTTNRVMIFDLAALGADLQTFGMMVVLEEVWRRIVANKRRGVRTWLYVDEFHVLFANDYAGAYCQSLFKRVRKYGAAATGITQNIEELLESERARLMLSNSDGLFLLNQQSTDADALTELLKLSTQQRSYFTNASPGTGLMKLGAAIVPFDNTMDPASHIFQLFSTKFVETPSVVS
ncbi:VirB4-like conjugal transfer ATPase, CD1110 family, partial [Arcanobacterium bovis]